MRRIYESSALKRDNHNPYHPNERDAQTRPKAMRTVPSRTLSRHLVPRWVRHRSIALNVSTPQTEYQSREVVPFVVTMKNLMPFPITIPTDSSVPWNWYVDGYEEASLIDLHDRTTEAGKITFDRGERKQFRKHWSQSFRISDEEWQPAPPGDYTIAAGINVPDSRSKGLWVETSVRVLPESA